MKTILENIHKAALRFLVPLDLTEIYKVIVDEAIKLVGAQYGSLLLEMEGELKRVYTTLPVANELKIRKNGFTYTSFREQKALVKKSKQYLSTKPILRLGLLSNIFIPLAYKGKSIGVLVVNSFENSEFTSKEMDILKLFGSLASLAIRKTQLYEETKRALEARDLFISMAAHELRTPLTTINGYAQLLKNKFIRSDSSSEQRWIDELSWEIYRLTNLVNELLTVNNITSGKLTYSFKNIKLQDIVQRVVTNFKFSHHNTSIEINDEITDKEDMVIGDPDKLLQVVYNLLDNAAKFSEPNSKIVIYLKFQRPFVILQLKDFGRGIDKKDMPKVFDNYYRGNSHNREGMGIGLYLIKNIIEKHRGSINIKSRLAKGTTVTIKLPRVRL